MQGRRNQTQETVYYMNHLYEMSRMGKSIETESGSMFARGRELEKLGAPISVCLMTMGSHSGVMK